MQAVDTNQALLPPPSPPIPQPLPSQDPWYTVVRSIRVKLLCLQRVQVHLPYVVIHWSFTILWTCSS